MQLVVWTLVALRGENNLKAGTLGRAATGEIGGVVRYRGALFGASALLVLGPCQRPGSGAGALKAGGAQARDWSGGAPG